MRFRSTKEVIALYCASKAFTFASPDDIHAVTGSKSCFNCNFVTFFDTWIFNPEFPQETQDAIIMAFVEEALGKSAEETKLIADFQKQGLAAIDELEKSKQELEDKKKMLELKESM